MLRISYVLSFNLYLFDDNFPIFVVLNQYQMTILWFILSAYHDAFVVVKSTCNLSFFSF